MDLSWPEDITVRQNPDVDSPFPQASPHNVTPAVTLSSILTPTFVAPKSVIAAPSVSTSGADEKIPQPNPVSDPIPASASESP